MNPVERFRRVFWICAGAAIVAAGAVAWRGTDGTPAAVIDVVMVLTGIGAVFLYLWIVVEYRILRPLRGLEEDLRSVLRDGAGPVDHRSGTLIEPLARAVDRLARTRTGDTTPHGSD